MPWHDHIQQNQIGQFLFACVQRLLAAGDGANGMVGLEDVAPDVQVQDLVVHNQRVGLSVLVLLATAPWCQDAQPGKGQPTTAQKRRPWWPPLDCA